MTRHRNVRVRSGARFLWSSGNCLFIILRFWFWSWVAVSAFLLKALILAPHSSRSDATSENAVSVGGGRLVEGRHEIVACPGQAHVVAQEKGIELEVRGLKIERLVRQPCLARPASRIARRAGTGRVK